jgi:hypothetical protein
MLFVSAGQNYSIRPAEFFYSFPLQTRADALYLFAVRGESRNARFGSPYKAVLNRIIRRRSDCSARFESKKYFRAVKSARKYCDIRKNMLCCIWITGFCGPGMS